SGAWSPLFRRLAFRYSGGKGRPPPRYGLRSLHHLQESDRRSAGGAHAMTVHAVREAVAEQAASIEVLPMAIHTGAEIRGVDLSRPLPPEQVSAVRAALLRWKV